MTGFLPRTIVYYSLLKNERILSTRRLQKEVGALFCPPFQLLVDVEALELFEIESVDKFSECC